MYFPLTSYKLVFLWNDRLKFSVVSEPMDDSEECVDVGHAFLDLQELLLTGNDVIEQQIDSRCWVANHSKRKKRWGILTEY